MKYAIMVRERGADRLVELCRVASNPQAVVDAAAQKLRRFPTGKFGKKGNDRGRIMQAYEHIEIREIADA